jgi:DNA-binding CsgD family transcriptional regulator
LLRITPAERTALQLLAEGKGRTELAASLDVSEVEVEARLMVLFRRMGVRTAREAAAECVRRGLTGAKRFADVSEA